MSIHSRLTAFRIIRQFMARPMNRTLLLLTISAFLLTGCRSRPLQTVMRGSMVMDGDMRVAGDMNMAGEVTTIMRTDNRASRLNSLPVYASPNQPSCGKIAVLDVDGLLVNQNLSGLGSMGENPVALFREKLDAIAVDDSVAAIILRINSPGGGVTAADMMTRDLMQLKAQRGLPVVACLMDVGAGGGYYLATAADHIVAHPTSIVGGIGVIMNVYLLEDSLGSVGVYSIPIKAGDKIDLATPLRMMEANEREMLQQVADRFHERFIGRVEQSRPAAQSEMFDGRVMTGEQAFEAELLDQVGYLDDAVVAARELAGLPAHAPLIMLRRDNDRAHTLLDVTPNTPTMSSLLPVSVPGLERSKLPTFMYLWQPEPSFVTTAGG